MEQPSSIAAHNDHSTTQDQASGAPPVAGSTDGALAIQEPIEREHKKVPYKSFK